MKGKLEKNCTKKMKNSVSNTQTCRRRFLFSDFLCHLEKDIFVSGYKCCDVSVLKCVYVTSVSVKLRYDL